MRFQIARALAHFLWEGAAIAALLWGLLQFLREAKLRYNACAGALALMCAAPVATLLWLAPQALTLQGTRGIVLDTGLPSSGVASVNWLEANAAWLFWLWLSGMLVLLARAAVAWWRARNLVTRGFEAMPGSVEFAARRLAGQLGAKRVRFRASARVASALVFGWLKPVVVLPVAALGRLTEAEIEALLAHELAHVIRGDFLVNLLQTVAECVLFYHPLVWWVSARMRGERELCCDDVAVAVCHDEVLYSRALLRLEELRMEPALAATGGRLAHRIRRLLGGPESGRITAAPGLALVLALGVSVALLAQIAPPEPPAPPAQVAEAPEAPAPPQPPDAPSGSVAAYRIGNGVSMPRPIYKVEPDYTPEAHAAHVEGRTFLSVVISPDGIAGDIKIVKSLDRGLDAKAIEAVRKWRFEPGRKDGKPVPVSANIEINFRLSDPPAPPVAAVAPVPPEPPSTSEALPAPPAPSAPPSNGVIGGIADGVRGGLVGGVQGGVAGGVPGGALDAQRAALEQERLRAAADRKAAAEERAEVAKARQAAEAALQADMSKAMAAANDPGSQKALEEMRKKVEALARAEAAKAKAEADIARQEMNIAAQEDRLAAQELFRAEREANRARAEADRMQRQAELMSQAGRQGNTKEAESERRRRYAADHFGGENTDRGKIYMHYGPPDEIESHPGQGKGAEIWRYKDATKSKVTLEVEFQDGKQVRRVGANTEDLEQRRRSRFADERWAATGGSQSDHGKAYVKYGPPDEIRQAPGGGEIWHYNGDGKDFYTEVEFDVRGHGKGVKKASLAGPLGSTLWRTFQEIAGLT